MKYRVLLCLILVVLFTSEIAARAYYVSATGNNNNNGLTEATAWQTISKVNSFFASMSAGDSILFRRGDTFFGTLIISRSGTSSLYMVIGAYGTGSKPVISGFLNASSWALVSGGVYQAPINAKSTLNMVTIDNVPQAIGRYPNDNASNGGYLSYESYTSSSITDINLDGGTDWTGAELAIRKKLWVLDRCKITANSGSVYNFTNINSNYEGTNGYGYFIQNDPRTLDKFGEWYFNNTSKNLQVYFGSASPSSYSIKASGLDTLLFISSKSYITIDNIAFDGANVNALHAVSSSNINIKNCDFTNAGTGAIYGSIVSNVLIENCTTYNILSNGILINSTRGSNITIRGCSVKRTGCIPGMGLSSGNSYKAIMASVSSGLLIEYNRVDTSGYVGIEFQGSNVTVKNNVVNYFDFIKDDAGGIYTYSSGSDASPGTIYTNRVVRDNIVMNGISAYNGRSSTSPFVTGIYLDGRTMNVDVLNNTVFNNAKNGIHCNNPQNVNIRGNTSFNNLNAISTMRWAHLGEIRNLNIKNNIFYPITASQRNYYYTNSGLNEPATTTVNASIMALGKIDSNYYSNINQAGFLQEIYTVTGGAIIATSPLSLDGWKVIGLHDTGSKKTAKLPVTYKVTGFVGTNKFTNSSFASSITGVTVFGTSTTGTWDNTGKINGGSLMINFGSPSANKYSLIHSPVGAISSAKKYLLRFSTYGTTHRGIIRAYIRKTTSPFTNLTPLQVKSFGIGRKDHEILFSAPTTDAAGSFVIEIEQNSGAVYFDNLEFYEVNAQLYDPNSQIRFEYNDTKLAKTVTLDGKYTAVDGTIYTTTVTLQPFTSVILVKDTGATPLSATVSATSIKCFGDSATVIVAATGGIQPYTGTGTFRVRAGTYTYTVRDSLGSTSSSIITVSQPASALSVAATTGTIAAAGGSTTITVTASGGTAPYSGTGTFTVPAGTYTYTVTDVNSCTATVTRIITDGTGPFTLSVAASPVAGGTVTGTGTYISGATATLTATPAAGYVFSGWSGAVTGISATVSVFMNANQNVTALFVPVTYTLAATSSPTAGGTVTGTGTYISGATATLTATPAAGYVFSGWSGAVTGISATVSVVMNANQNVTALFVPVTYTLAATSSPTAGGTVTGAGTYTSGTTATLTATPAAGYVFSGWSGTVTSTSATVTVLMNADQAVTATFIPVTYILAATSSPTAGGTVTGAGTYTFGTTATLTATPAAGYVFSGWSGAVTGTSATVTVVMNADQAVTATFVPSTYTMRTAVIPTGGGRAIGAGTYSAGATANLTALPEVGYTFAGWGGDASGTALTNTVVMTSDKLVTATFARIIHTLTATASPTEGGTVAGAGSYAYGTTATLTATPAAGYTFSGWSGAVTGTSATITLSMTSNQSVTANFTEIRYTMRTAVLPNSTAGRAIGAGTYLPGTIATLTAMAYNGYVFTGWGGDATGTSTTTTVVMSADKLVRANFAPLSYTLTAVSIPSAGGTITGAGTYTYGSIATLKASAAAGYTFTGWSGDTNVTDSVITFTVNANKNFIANFVAHTTLRIEDDVIGLNGLCTIQGIASTNTGANNSRSINLTNSIARGLDWSVIAGATGTYNLRWRYTNGATTNNFFMRLIINGQIIEDSIPFPRTTNSTTFAISTGNFSLNAGNNTIRLQSIDSRATADIDWMEVTGYAPATGECSQSGARPVAQTTESTLTFSARATGVYPNPATGRINIGFDLPATQRVSFVVLDAAANPVGELRGQIFPAGYNIQPFTMAGKAAGIYTVLVIGEKNVRKAYKFVVIQ